MPSDAATRGTLVVHLRSASNLRSADRGGSSDPYVKLSSALKGVEALMERYVD